MKSRASPTPSKTPPVLNRKNWSAFQRDVSDNAFDPYIWWHDLTDFRALSRDSASGKRARVDLFSFIAEGSLIEFRAEVESDASLKALVRIDTAYFEKVGPNRVARYFTFRVNATGLSNQQLVDVFKRLVGSKHLSRVQLGFSRGNPPENSGSFSANADCGPVPRKQRANVVIGVIDDGCAFAHERLRHPGAALGTRVSAIWDQTSFSDRFDLPERYAGFWAKLSGFSYGAVAHQEQLNSLMRLHSAPPLGGAEEVNEFACYQATVNPESKNRRNGRKRGMYGRASHGAAVTMLAAGSLQPGKKSDHASAAPVIFIDLPIEQVEISSGRWMPINGLDAMRFILSHARSRYETKDRTTVPVVINLSSGSGAGAHDGTSMMESAMDELLALDPHLSVVLAAGNARLSETHFECTIGPKSKTDVGVFISHDKPFESYAEFWFSPGIDLNRVSFRMRSPDATTSAWVSLSPEKKPFAVFENKNGAGQSVVVAALLLVRNAVQSKTRPMLLFATVGTRPHERYTNAPGGAWMIEVRNESKGEVTINGWIERDEVVFGRHRQQMAKFFNPAERDELLEDWYELNSVGITRRGTTSNIANGTNPFVVAAGTGATETGYVSAYSGSPTKTGKAPIFVARADTHAARAGILVSGNYRAAIRHMNGTSAAAPIATRFVANAMADGSTRQDIVNEVMKHPNRRIEPHTKAPAPHDGRYSLCDEPAQIGEFSDPH